MNKIELIKLLNQIEETAKGKSKWDRNYKYFQGVLDCVKTIKKAIEKEQK